MDYLIPNNIGCSWENNLAAYKKSCGCYKTKKFVRWYTGDAIVIFNNLKRNCETIYKNKKARQSAERSQDELKRNAFLALKNFQAKAFVFLTLKNFHLKIGRQVDLVSLQQQFDLLLPCPLPVGPGRQILFSKLSSYPGNTGTHDHKLKI